MRLGGREVEPTMSDQQVLEPSADHPITVEPSGSRVRVTSGDHVIADTTSALKLQESTYPAVFYVPLADVDQSLLKRTDNSPLQGQRLVLQRGDLGR
jgi:uncharacterized protein (DUF427 family)